MAARPAQAQEADSVRADSVRADSVRADSVQTLGDPVWESWPSPDTLGAETPGVPDAEVRIVTIVNADSVSGTVVDGERVRTLIGNVHLIQDSTDLRARQATQFLDREEILFEGAVEIADGVDTLNARTVTYGSRTRVGRAEGDVRLADDEAELFSNSVTHFRSEGRAEFDEPVRLVERDGSAVLTSERGRYLSGTKEAFFRDNVRLVDSLSVLTSERGRYGTEDKRADFSGNVRLRHRQSTRVEADSLTHFRTPEVSVARGDVLVERFGGRRDDEDAEPDTTRRTLLFGEQAFHDERARFSRVEIDPLLVRLQADSAGIDTLLVRADILEASQPDSVGGRPPPPGATFQRLVARRSVRLYGPSLAAVGDSAVFNRVEFEADSAAAGSPATDSLATDSTPTDSLATGSAATDPAAGPTDDEVWLFRDPVGWMNARGSTLVTEVSGDSIRVTARSEAVDSVRVLGRAFAARPDSLLGRVNQMRGRQMLALFAQDSLRWMHVWPNAESAFFRADSAGALEGAVRLSADSLAFRFDGDALRRVQGTRGIEGTYYDAGLVPSPLRLDGFRYAPERRPTRASLLADNPLERNRARPDPPAEPAEAPEPIVLPAEPLREIVPSEDEAPDR
ncbi:MAG: OstA-like protein [Bacteroidota bacterium]